MINGTSGNALSLCNTDLKRDVDLLVVQQRLAVAQQAGPRPAATAVDPRGVPIARMISVPPDNR
jgi:hypothetical protein